VVSIRPFGATRPPASFFITLIEREKVIPVEMQDTPRVIRYWKKFLSTLPGDSPYRRRGYYAEKWGDTRETADELGRLIADGVKTATCSSVWEWEAEGRSVPEEGLITMVLDWNGDPLCLIETVAVDIQPFHRVDERFAYEEGEGDRTLRYWREAHWRHFTRTLAAIGKRPSEDMLLVCERIRVIYKG
jgi:uncharacterized protein YhfF